MFVCSLSLTRENWKGNNIPQRKHWNRKQFSCAFQKHLENDKHNGIHLVGKCACIYRGVLRYYQFLVIHSLPQASQNRSCLWTNIRAYFLSQMKAIINLNYKNVAGEWTPRYHGQKIVFFSLVCLFHFVSITINSVKSDRNKRTSFLARCLYYGTPAKVVILSQFCQ